MTTQTPHDPAHRQPDAVYPTAPPWAPQQQPPDESAPPGPGWAGGAHTRHGQLMVAYPELLHAAGRAKPPSWVPVVLITFLTMPFGAISAARRAGRARHDGNPRYPYWLAFGLTFGVSAVLSMIMVALAVPAYLTFREAAVTTAVESSLVHDGKIKTSDGATVRSAQCTPTQPLRADGTRAYRCVVVLSNGQTATLKAVADGKGNLTAVKY